MIEYKPLYTVAEAAEISGKELVKRLQQDFEDGVTGCRSLSYKGDKRKVDQDLKNEASTDYGAASRSIL